MAVRGRDIKPVGLDINKNYLSMSNIRPNMDNGSLFGNCFQNSINLDTNSNSGYSGLAPSGGSTASCGNSVNCVA